MSRAVMALVVLLPGIAGAQAPRPPAGGAPLRDEPGDWWGDVHRWTGSDATRPRGGAARSAAPAPPTGRTVTTVRTGRANLRRDPSMTAPVARMLPPGTVLNVFAEGPDGWLQVGEGDRPAGWIHPTALAAP
ncbi:SH3 domain-containing protein [Roseomonas fluvialis]|uniref:SH3 domain-containing protein n=1 Tax=Roseomonas fluvialis TaxID=1750527 RepID=UPI001FCE0C2C|nr:SH3 domain-containing protein [Roseomonas fluvialis]